MPLAYVRRNDSPQRLKICNTFHTRLHLHVGNWRFSNKLLTRLSLRTVCPESGLAHRWFLCKVEQRKSDQGLHILELASMSFTLSSSYIECAQKTVLWLMFYIHQLNVTANETRKHDWGEELSVLGASDRGWGTRTLMSSSRSGSVWLISKQKKRHET